MRPLIREACLAARLLHQPSLQPPLQSNQELLLDGQGPSGYAPRLSIQAFLKLGTKAQYVNMFVKYEHFTYETLAGVTEYLHQGDCFVLTDAKSGYHHIRMPSYSKASCRSALHACMTSSGVGDCKVRQDHLASVVIGCGNMAQDL